jgi:HEAT repeat protein
MNAGTWSDITAALGSKDIDTCVAAASRLHKESTPEDVPFLLELLRTGDSFEREAAAWPLAEIAGATHLHELFEAYQLGFEEGNDNDGFTAALLEIPALYPVEARLELTRLASSAADPMRAHVVWLLDFCEST